MLINTLKTLHLRPFLGSKVTVLVVDDIETLCRFQYLLRLVFISGCQSAELFEVYQGC